MIYDIEITRYKVKIIKYIVKIKVKYWKLGEKSLL